MGPQVLCDSEQVTLSVGGARFTTTVSTLRGAPAPSLFAAMFSGRHELQRSPQDGSIFIDRDGRHFADGGRARGRRMPHGCGTPSEAVAHLKGGRAARSASRVRHHG
jgi:hypothetical protein